MSSTMEDAASPSPSRHLGKKQRAGNSSRNGVRAKGKDGSTTQKPKEKVAMDQFSVAGDFKRKFKNNAIFEKPHDMSVDIWKVTQSARHLDMTLDEVREVIYVFNSIDTDHSGFIDYGEFEKAAMNLLQGGSRKAETEVVKLSCKEDWANCQREMPDRMILQEFLEWFSRIRFRSDLLLSKEQRDMMGLARKYQITEKVIEQIRQAFDSFDKDGSGMIHLKEFQSVLRAVMRLSSDCDLPVARVQSLWREIDTDHSGEACFEEFLRWWIGRKETLIPYDHFYKNIRCLRSQKYDPSAYGLETY